MNSPPEDCPKSWPNLWPEAPRSTGRRPDGRTGRIVARLDRLLTATLAGSSPDPSDSEPPLVGSAPDPLAESPEADGATFEHALRIAEALIFASDRPVKAERLQMALPMGCDATAVLTALQARSAGRAVQLVEIAGGFVFRTALELAPAITRVVEVPRRLPRVAMETLAIIAYHQPVTRPEIEEIRGATVAQATIDALLEMSLVTTRGRKESPGRPSLWVTAPRFLEQFGLKSLADLPRREELISNDAALPLIPPTPG